MGTETWSGKLARTGSNKKPWVENRLNYRALELLNHLRMPQQPHITVLGGGISGLAVGFYARKSGYPVSIYEAADRFGGNATTFEHNGFLFDSGAHRFHDQDRVSTQDIKHLLGEELKAINVPSQIYYKGKFFDFPLSPVNLFRGLGPSKALRAAYEVVTGRLFQKSDYRSFAGFAKRTYGETLAESFLLNYSEKLWGTPCDRLSPSISGKRLQGLTLKTFVIESLFGKMAKTEHLDGSFYYPTKGIGKIADAFAEYIGFERIRLNSSITKVIHDNRKIREVEVNENGTTEVEYLVSSMPVNNFLNILEPAPPEELQIIAKSLRFRSMILVAFFLKKRCVTKNASIYFPDRHIPFTRIYEPKMRSRDMSPVNKTSLVVEIPCQQEDPIWKRSEKSTIDMVKAHLVEIGLISKDDILDAQLYRMNYAYPILETGYEEKIAMLRDYLYQFDNLALTGRTGRFAYIHIHDMMKIAREIISGLGK